MKQPKYKIGQEVYRVDLEKPKETCVVAHQISEIRMKEDLIEYTMFVHGYWCEEDHCDMHTYPEVELFETKEEANEKWMNRIKAHKVKKVEKELKILEDNTLYKDNSVARAENDREEHLEKIKEKKKELHKLTVIE